VSLKDLVNDTQKKKTGGSCAPIKECQLCW